MLLFTVVGPLPLSSRCGTRDPERQPQSEPTHASTYTFHPIYTQHHQTCLICITLHQYQLHIPRVAAKRLAVASPKRRFMVGADKGREGGRSLEEKEKIKIRRCESKAEKDLISHYHKRDLRPSRRNIAMNSIVY